jgi:hypothetical protein
MAFSRLEGMPRRQLFPRMCRESLGNDRPRLRGPLVRCQKLDLDRPVATRQHRLGLLAEVFRRVVLQPEDDDCCLAALAALFRDLAGPLFPPSRLQRLCARYGFRKFRVRIDPLVDRRACDADFSRESGQRVPIAVFRVLKEAPAKRGPGGLPGERGRGRIGTNCCAKCGTECG